MHSWNVLICCVFGLFSMSVWSCVDGIECYTCADTSVACVSDVTSLPPSTNLNCNSTTHACFVYEQYLGANNSLESISRGCAAKFFYKNECLEDPKYTTCYSMCETDLCNTDKDLLERYTSSATDFSLKPHLLPVAIVTVFMKKAVEGF